MPSRSSTDSSGSTPPRRPRQRQTARRGRPFDRRAYQAREAISAIIRDEVADAITLALRTIESIIRVYSRIPGHQDLIRALRTIYSLLADLRITFAPL